MTIAANVLPDVETLVIQYLKDHAGVLALIPATRISSELPSQPSFPYLTVAMGPGVVRVEGHLAGWRMQGDAWGGTREQARALALVAQAALAGIPRATYPEGIVTGAETLAAPRKFPDPVSNRPRYTFDVRVWATPAPAAS